MNIDPSEKEKFNKIAEEWWDPDGKFAPLHVINPLRSNYISEKIELQGIKALDVACGGGLLAESLHCKGANVTGVDIYLVAIHTAIKHANKIEFEINYFNIVNMVNWTMTFTIIWSTLYSMVNIIYS